MKTLTLKQSLKDLKGDVLKNGDREIVTVGSAAATIILMVKEDLIRSLTMAQTLYKEEKIELNTSDFDYLQAGIKAHASSVYGNALIGGQLLVILSELKDIEEKTK